MDLDKAITELREVIDESAEMYQQLKRVKFDYLVQTCELYTKIDLPSMMIEACRKSLAQDVPGAKQVDKMEF